MIARRTPHKRSQLGYIVSAMEGGGRITRQRPASLPTTTRSWCCSGPEAFKGRVIDLHRSSVWEKGTSAVC
jgi:hypothetical protein